MATTSPARIDDDLYASANLVDEIQSRSASQQVAHWARIGREVEASASISHKSISEALAGSQSYDTLSAEEQAIVRAEWSSRIDRFREELNLAKQFADSGRAWVELEDDGTIVQRDATATSRISDGIENSTLKRGSSASSRTKRRTVEGTGAGTAEPPKQRTRSRS